MDLRHGFGSELSETAMEQQPMTRYAPIALALAGLAACQTIDEAPSTRVAQAALSTADGAPVGTARVFRNGGEITLTATAFGLAPGVHGIHLHAIGRCDGPDFATAGGHLNPGGREHGHDNPAGAHLGDLPNLTAGPDGAGTVSARLDGSPEAILAQLFDADGTALVIHAAADDYRTDPSGNSGARIVCGVLTRV